MKLIVISGWATPVEALTSFIKNLSRLFQIQVYAISDLMGNISSPEGSNKLDLPSPSEFAENLAEKLKIESDPCWLAGFSMGGMIALEAACWNSDKILGLILAGTTPSFCIREGFAYGKPVESVRALSLNLFKDAQMVLSRFYEQV